MRSLPFLFVVFSSAICLGAEPGAEEKFKSLPAADSVIGAAGVEGFKLAGTGARRTVNPVSDQSFREAVTITTETQPANPWSVQLTCPTAAAVKKGDAVLGVFAVRARQPLPGDGEARTEFVFEQRAEPFTKSASFPVTVSPEWRWIYVPFEAKADFAAGEANVCLRAGYSPQSIEIGGLQVLDYGTRLSVKDLPYTHITYSGREKDAAWRKAAAERIEAIRKGAIQVVVTRGGNPVPNAEVHLAMQRHAFGFGSAVNARKLVEQSGDGDRYRAIVSKLFNKVVIENDLKWNVWEDDRETGPKAVAWLREHHIAVRGHCLVWPGWKNLPASLRALESKPDALRAAVLDHIRDEVTALKGQCVEWDVVNEPYTNTDLQKILGDGILADCFKAAHDCDPTAKLDINDYSILSSGGKDTPHQTGYEKAIRTLLDAGAPVQGIGLQSHFGEDLTPPDRMLAILDRFSRLGLPIQGTEHDVNVSDEDLQADFTRDYLTVMFSHPSVIGVIVWGFWEQAHWIPNAAYYRKDWSVRPAGTAWQDLVFKEWWTNTTLKTAKDGGCETRAFLGTYRIEARASGFSKVTTAEVVRNGTRLEIPLD